LVLTELPRSIRARADIDSHLDVDLSLGRSEILLQRVDMHPVDRLTLWRAGRIFEPHLRSFDAVHVVTALNVRPIDAFVTYDLRQAESALVEGLNVRSPGT
jgi:hypothetical protein